MTDRAEINLPVCVVKPVVRGARLPNGDGCRFMGQSRAGRPTKTGSRKMKNSGPDAFTESLPGHHHFSFPDKNGINPLSIGLPPFRVKAYRPEGRTP